MKGFLILTIFFLCSFNSFGGSKKSKPLPGSSCASDLKSSNNAKSKCEKEKKSLTSQKSQIQNELNSVKSERDSLLQNNQTLASQIQEANAEMTTCNNNVDSCVKEVNACEASLIAKCPNLGEKPQPEKPVEDPIDAVKISKFYKGKRILRGKEYFRAVIFNYGKIADEIPSISKEDHLKYKVSSPEELKKVIMYFDQLLIVLEKKNPKLFYEFGVEMESGNQVRIDKAIKKAQEEIRKWVVSKSKGELIREITPPELKVTTELALTKMKDVNVAVVKDTNVVIAHSLTDVAIQNVNVAVNKTLNVNKDTNINQALNVNVNKAKAVSVDLSVNKAMNVNKAMDVNKAVQVQKSLNVGPAVNLNNVKSAGATVTIAVVAAAVGAVAITLVVTVSVAFWNGIDPETGNSINRDIPLVKGETIDSIANKYKADDKLRGFENPEILNGVINNPANINLNPGMMGQ